MGRRRERGEQQGGVSQHGWQQVLAGEASREAYQRALRAHTAMAWDAVEAGQDDLLRLLVGRVPAELGVTALLGLSVLFAGHPKGDDAGRALLATVLADLEPQRARTLLVTLEDAWHNAGQQAFERRAGALLAALQQGLRRLQATEMPEAQREALGFIGELLEQAFPDGA